MVMSAILVIGRWREIIARQEGMLIEELQVSPFITISKTGKKLKNEEDIVTTIGNCKWLCNAKKIKLSI